MINVKIEKLTLSGQGLGYYEGKEALVWNALPGEEVEVEKIWKKQGRLEGVASKIIKTSPDRQDPKEPDHYLSCSPWQILSWEKENEWKEKIAADIFSRAGVNLPEKELKIITEGSKQFHYRNKMEYSFTLDDIGDISLAFFKRGQQQMVPIAACHLAHTNIIQRAQSILSWLNANPVSDEMCKSLIVRSNSKEETIAALFITEYFNFPELPQLSEQFRGFHIYYSRGESPASTPDKLIYSEGEDYLLERISGKKLKFGLLSFFQVHPPIFEKVLEDIEPWLDPKRTLVDFYSGVGAISLPLYGKYKKAILVDESREAIQFARENISAHGFKKCEAKRERSENITNVISKHRQTIFDPPRPGLHPKIIKKVLEEKPFRIIYLSCNLETQAKDIKELRAEYKVSFFQIYNFFPRTPHIEGLCVLDRI
jgi:23S rRNA (uracil-5-)-methyltransferase RumA